MSAQKGPSRVRDREQRELLGGTEEKSISPMRIFYTKEAEKIELVAKPILVWSPTQSRVVSEQDEILRPEQIQGPLSTQLKNNKNTFYHLFDTDFKFVMHACIVFTYI